MITKQISEPSALELPNQIDAPELPRLFQAIILAETAICESDKDHKDQTANKALDLILPHEKKSDVINTIKIFEAENKRNGSVERIQADEALLRALTKKK
jgi:LytS/YehU family sensor histidine kinase